MAETKDKAEAWKDFWAQQSKGQGGGGCLPARWAAIEDAQKTAWRRFADGLPARPRLLDLATGDARVLRWMQEMLDEPVLIGVDLAPALPPAPPGCEVRAGVAMEDLPFENGSFDAITSQFGFEYGDTPKIAAEIDRVASATASVGLMVHRGDGPILEHNIARQTQIGWVLDERALLERVIAASNEGTEGLQRAIDIAAETVRDGAAHWGQGSAAWEIPEAVRRTLLLGRQGPREKMLDTLELIRNQALNEVGRIASLAQACEAADRREALLEGFAGTTLEESTTLPVEEPSGRVFADLVILKRG